jgi:GR25 family glycosyltransferase involved in LPS biosynthesis
MNILNATFEKIVYINLRKRKDRKRECEEELQKHGIIAERFNALQCRPYDAKMTKNEQGCLLSHRSVIQQAKDAGLSNVLILEDDFHIVPAPNTLEWEFYEFYKDVPSDWQMLYLGGNHFTCHPTKKLMTVKIRPHVLKCNFTLTTGAYAVSQSAYDIILDDLETPRFQVDAHYAFLQERLKAYGACPSLIVQRPSFSDIQDRFVDYTQEGAIK